MVPSDRTARSQRSARLGAPLPEDGNTARYQNVVLLQKIRELTKSQKKKIVSVNFGHAFISLVSTLGSGWSSSEQSGSVLCT